MKWSLVSISVMGFLWGCNGTYRLPDADFSAPPPSSEGSTTGDTTGTSTGGAPVQPGPADSETSGEQPFPPEYAAYLNGEAVSLLKGGGAVACLSDLSSCQGKYKDAEGAKDIPPGAQCRLTWVPNTYGRVRIISATTTILLDLKVPWIVSLATGSIGDATAMVQRQGCQL